jgi:hypothetical protein
VIPHRLAISAASRSTRKNLRLVANWLTNAHLLNQFANQFANKRASLFVNRFVNKLVNLFANRFVNKLANL